MQVSEGIAIQLLVDVSSSMDMSMKLPDGESKTRMDVAKELVKDFIGGDGDKLEGRDGDLIGLITFARYPDTRSPLTFSHPALLQLVESLEVQDRPNEDGTAYAMPWPWRRHASNTLMSWTNPDAGRSPVTSPVASSSCLPTARTTPVSTSPSKRLASPRSGTARSTASASETHPHRPENPGIRALSSAERVLDHISRETGGVFRTAHDYESLKSVYEEIDQLEPSKITSRNFTEIAEWFWLPLIGALCFLALGIVLETTWLFTIP